jgi:bifunctional non-homologous end joining protein LigD
MNKLKPSRMPKFISPQLATLTKKYFSDENWIYEEKFDGIRCIAIKNGSNVILYSRNQNVLNGRFPSIVEELKKQKIKNFIIDGEIVAFNGRVTSFSKLQQIKIHKVDVYYYVFDLMYFDKYNLVNQKLLDRKKILKETFLFTDKFRYTPHIVKEGEKFYKEACKKGFEGIIAKKIDSYYESRRTTSWLKFKCVNRQEFIIVGYTSPEGQRFGFGSLLIGYFEKNKLVYAGKVGTGFNFEFLKDFSKKLNRIKISKNPFDDLIIKNAFFVEPKYVAEIGFAEWTLDNKLRHPRFLGLREDKNPKDVVKEV